MKSVPQSPKPDTAEEHAAHAPAFGVDPREFFSTTSNPTTLFSFPPSVKAWSTNQDRTTNPYLRAERIKAWKIDAKLAYTQLCNSAGSERQLPPGIVTIAIPFDKKRRRDPHNYCGTVLKAIIDGLVLAKAWPDDTPEYVGHREPKLYVGMACWVRIEHPPNFILTNGVWKLTE